MNLFAHYTQQKLEDSGGGDECWLIHLPFFWIFFVSSVVLKIVPIDYKIDRI